MTSQVSCMFLHPGLYPALLLPVRRWLPEHLAPIKNKRKCFNFLLLGKKKKKQLPDQPLLSPHIGSVSPLPLLSSSYIHIQSLGKCCQLNLCSRYAVSLLTTTLASTVLLQAITSGPGSYHSLFTALLLHPLLHPMPDLLIFFIRQSG